MPEEFNLKEMEKRIRRKLRSPKPLLQRLKETARIRKPKLPRI